MTRYLLDTNICIHLINRQPNKVFRKFKTLKIGQVAISAITYAELQYGVANSSNPDENQRTLNKFLGPLEVLDFPAKAGQVYGKIRTELQAKGKMIGGNDLLIAAHAIDAGCTLVTNNVREFKRVKNLDIENWA